MKNILIILAILLQVLRIQAQCLCEMSFQETTDCCYQMFYTLEDAGGAIPCLAMGYNRIIIQTNTIPAQGSEVVSINLVNPNHTATLNPLNNVVTVQSSVPLISPPTLGAPILLGTICLAGGPQPPVDALIHTIFDNSGLPAAGSCESDASVDLACAIPSEWTAFCGDDSLSAVVVNRIHAFNDGVYVTGVKEYFNGFLYATFSKYDINDGSLVWQKVMGTPTYFTDFAYIAEEDAFICVGRTDPFQTATMHVNNKSVLVKFDDQGNILASKFYDQVGREGFSQILRHSDPPNPQFPFFVLGTRNPDPGGSFPPAPNSWDVPVVFNISASLNLNWARRYDNPFIGAEYEVSRGFFEKGQDLILTGNDVPDNDGVVIQINGLSGFANFVREYTSADYDFYEGLELPNGWSVVAGSDFGAGQAVVLLLDPLNNPVKGLQYPDIKEFREIGLDSDGRIYTVGQLKNGADYYVISRIIHAGASLVHDQSAYLDEGGSVLPMGHFDVTPDFDAIFYADARKGSPLSTGIYRLLVSSLDLDMANNPCLVSSPQNPFVIEPQAFLLEINSPPLAEPPFVSITATDDLVFVCDAICGGCNIAASISATINCFTVDLEALASGAGPFTFAWDFDCDGSIDATSQQATWVLPDILPHQVCLTVTDATGCVETYQVTVQAEDQIAPAVTCSDLLLPTDPGECFATLAGPYVTYSDNCFPNSDLIVECEVNGSPLPATLPKGAYVVICTVEDPIGNVGTCFFEIRVEDQEPPIAICPEDIVVNIGICEATFVTFLPAAGVTDNCPMATVSCDLEEEVAFNCGQTAITCTATDMAGNTDDCTYTVTVNCQCAEAAGFEIICTEDPDIYEFVFQVNNLTGEPSASCILTATATTPNIAILSQTMAWMGNTGTVSGTFMVTGPPVPTTVGMQVSMICDCLAAACEVSANQALPCCEEVSLGDLQVCDGAVVQIPLLGCDDLDFITQVTWYVAPAPCPPGDWGDPFLVITDPLALCNDLELYTQYFSGDICVYAEVVQSNAAGPCLLLTTNVLTVSICEPVTCSIAGGQDYCYTGTPVVPGLLTLNLSGADPDCDYTVQWYDVGGPVSGATGLSFQAPALSFLGAPDDCYYDHVFTAEITDNCGTRTCSASFRLYNDDAPVGTLEMDPLEPMPFCPGEDATLKYTPECAGENPMWEWWESADGINYTHLADAGTMNPLYNTNRLFADTWYRVKKYVGGGCQADLIDFMIDVKEPLSINYFVVNYSPPCATDKVELEVDFSPCTNTGGCSCDYTVEWYKDGVLLASTSHVTTPAIYNHMAAPDEISGNYYAIVRDNCCPGQVKKTPVVEVERAWDVIILGHCSRCGPEEVELEAAFLHSLPAGCTPSYQWTTSGGNIVGAANESTVKVNKGGDYFVDVTCGGCTRQASFTLLHCWTVATKEVLLPGIDWEISPNPTSGDLLVEIFTDNLKGPFEIRVSDALGRDVISGIPLDGKGEATVEMGGLPPGIYFLYLHHASGVIAKAKVVKQ
ncbi:MAG: HYR domain-containing protein [Saprospiraceae bacterium]